MRSWKEMGIQVPEVFLPTTGNLEKWCVIACDQYTSDAPYWSRVEQSVGDAPSTLHMVLPEAYLGTEKERGRAESAAAAMDSYLADGTLRRMPPGFILVQRSFEGKPQRRNGLVAALDLEQYDYSPGSASLIRASEGTIEQRLPARVAIRSRAALELPHIMVLIDDPQFSVIEPLIAEADKLDRAYSSRLGFGMGSIDGWHVPPERAEGARAALSALLEKKLDSAGNSQPMLYAMGDGNHSFAAAKAYWDGLKPTLDSSQLDSHPARYALCELVNVHDAGLEFEAIHRVVACCGGMKGVGALADAFNGMGAKTLLSAKAVEGMQNIRFISGSELGYLNIGDPPHPLEAGSVDMAIENLLAGHNEATVDYVHGDDEAISLGRREGNMALMLPVLGKDMLFSYVERNGPLPRKAFSMGAADEKRCYLEARCIRHESS